VTPRHGPETLTEREVAAETNRVLGRFKAKQMLGERYLLHPRNRVQRLAQPAPSNVTVLKRHA